MTKTKPTRFLSEKERTFLANYPIKDGHREHYVKHPLDLSPDEWVAVRVSAKGGYIAWDADRNNPTLYIFKTEEECQKACDIHNNYHFNISRTHEGEQMIKLVLDLSFGRTKVN